MFFKLNNVFWEKVCVTWVKWVLWHALWGSWAQSVSIAVSSMINNIIPGTHNYNWDNRMEWIADLNILSENKQWQVKYILINSFWFGWHNVCLLLEKHSVFYKCIGGTLSAICSKEKKNIPMKEEAKLVSFLVASFL